MPTWVIEGTWSGYTSSQERCVHREYTMCRKYAEKVAALGHIGYSDGTSLWITVTQRTKSSGKRKPAIDGYSKLIRKCINAKVNHVDKLHPPKEAAIAP